MPTTRVKSRPAKTEDRFAVGWQKLTREEFLEALSVALLEKVRSYQPANDHVMQQPSEQAPQAI
jgi:hypothetical protein